MLIAYTALVLKLMAYRCLGTINHLLQSLDDVSELVLQIPIFEHETKGSGFPVSHCLQACRNHNADFAGRRVPFFASP